MKKSLKLKLLVNKEDLRLMMMKMSSSIFKHKQAISDNDLQLFIDCHFAIYIMYDGSKPVGITSYTYNRYYGMRKPTISNDYIYIDEPYRSGKTMLLFSLQTGSIIVEYDCELEHYISSDDSSRFSKRLAGSEIYTAMSYEPDEVIREYNKLRKLNFKIESKLTKIVNC